MWALMLLACTGNDTKESTSDAPPINQGDDTAEDCTGATPVITAVHVQSDGTVNSEGVDFAAISVRADAEDDDGDLYTLRMDLWHDDVVDGSVDTSGPAQIPSDTYHIPNSTTCALFMTTYGLKIPVDNVNILEKTTYEFAAVIYDAHGIPSAPVVGSGTTPAAL